MNNTAEYINTLLIHLVFKISSKTQATVFCAKNAALTNESVKHFLGFVQQYYEVPQREIDRALKAFTQTSPAELQFLCEDSQNLFLELLKADEGLMRRNVMSNVSRFKNSDAIENICKHEKIETELETQKKRITNIQKGMSIMKQEVIKTQMSVRYTNSTAPFEGDAKILQKVNSSKNVTTNDTESGDEQKNVKQTEESNSNVFVFQTGADKTDKKVEQIKRCLEPLEVYEFWEGYGMSITPKVVIMVVEGTTDSISKDVQLIKSLFPSCKIFVVYPYKKNKATHLRANAVNKEFDLLTHKGQFSEDQNFRVMLNYCFQ
ncbi:hypothetical protein EIN_155190 [Entamoeba invadens IP1]|uniref:Uncharacterized protein n=1 Tax=Entamoeba invadens IP1 TaxID=370355 RepID=A0A0A1U9A3_ENTIV|nr:hypothetical protein EIN_155190 [Entamoeba invadens IP1]ELP91412.1 hypothetical protein EIN_155190 [Entamoeba invadens IP1]|eukprot:XP_004258183.1 hypothetical protein EIN_155190 [Entamoeba invadens IP1]